MQETQEELEAVFGEEMRAAGTLGRVNAATGDAEKGSSSKKRSRSQERVREWEDGAEFALQREIVEGEVGDRGDGVVQQGGAPPGVEQHGGAGGKVDAASRKAAKKQRRLAEKKQHEEEKAKKEG